MSEARLFAVAPFVSDAAEAAVLAPRSPAEASRPVAGVSHLARLLIAAERDGARHALVLVADSPALRHRVEQELARARCTIEVDWSSPEAVGALPGQAKGLGDPRALARQVLLATGKPTDGLVSRWLNRPVSRWISARVLLIPGVRPWHLTLVTAAIAFLMFALLCFGGRNGVVLGALLFHLASVVDGVDGEIARAAYRSSRRGALLDTSVDMATNLLFTLGVTLGLIRLHGPLYALVGGLAVSIYLAGVLLLAALVRMSGQGPTFDLLKLIYSQRFPSGWRAHVVAAVRTATSRDFFAFLFALLALAGAAAAIPWLVLGAAGLWLLIIIATASTVIGDAVAAANRP